MKQLKVSREFVLRAHSAACPEWKRRIEEEFPGLIKHDFPLGSWVVNTGGCGPLVGRVVETAESGWEAEYIKEDGTKLNLSLEMARLATPQEVKKQLCMEAKRRGYKEGVRIIPFNSEGEPFGSAEIYCDSNYGYDMRLDLFWMGHTGFLYSKGKWAEIEPVVPKDVKEVIDRYGSKAIKKYLKAKALRS